MELLWTLSGPFLEVPEKVQQLERVWTLEVTGASNFTGASNLSEASEMQKLQRKYTQQALQRHALAFSSSPSASRAHLPAVRIWGAGVFARPQPPAPHITKHAFDCHALHSITITISLLLLQVQHVDHGHREYRRGRAPAVRKE